MLLLFCFVFIYVQDTNDHYLTCVLGNTAMRHFLKSHPTILMHLPLDERLRTVHAKIYNERNKSRSIANKDFLKDDDNNKKRKASGCHGIL